MAAGAAHILGQATTGRVLTIFCDDVSLARRQFRAATEELEPVPTLVALEWERAPSLARELDEIRDALADAAVSLWPDWYITAERRFDRSRSPSTHIEALLDELAQGTPGVSTSWLREAWQRCQANQPPLVQHMACAEQVRQLSRALDPQRLIFALSVVSELAPPARVRSLARAAEWLAHEAGAKTLLLAPESWQSHPELDHVTYGAAMLRTADEPTPSQARHRQPQTEETPRAERSHAPHEASVQVVVGPIIGKPHPKSHVEQLLYSHICREAQLASLFQFNQRLNAQGKHYIVDLVWREGGLVVELDGTEHHNRPTYVKDRDRDYQLFMSGYTTLRVTNDEICVDVEGVLDKIRNVVGRLRALRKAI